MQTQRAAQQGNVDPAYEDQGLFAVRPLQVTLQAMPVYGSNGRGDIVIHGFVERDGQRGRAVEILFAGRRKPFAAPLKDRLEAKWHKARKTAEAKDKPIPAKNETHLRVCALGSWRIRPEETEDGWRTKCYQFVVAKWAVPTREGEPKMYGEWPIGDWGLE